MNVCYDQLPTHIDDFQYTQKLFTSYILTSLGYLLKVLLQIILPTILLVEHFDYLVLKYVAAINVIIWCFDTMLVISKWPGKFKQIDIDF